MEEESGISLETPQVRNLKDSIRKGDWNVACDIVQALNPPKKILLASIFLILEQRYLETVYNSGFVPALPMLKELSKAAFDDESKKRVHQLSVLLICKDKDAVKNYTNWDNNTNRNILWDKIRLIFPCDILLSPHRLDTLLLQARELQIINCQHHCDLLLNTSVWPLLDNHKCRENILPQKCISRLVEHTDEIWVLAVSPNGNYFASGSKDQSIILWQFSLPFRKLFVYKEHVDAVTSISWSPNSEYLASTSNDGNLLIWKPDNPDSIARLPSLVLPTAVIWVDDSNLLITGLDKLLQLITLEKYKLSATGNNQSNRFTLTISHKWNFGCRLQDVGVTFNGEFAVIVCLDRQIRVVDLKTKNLSYVLPENSAVSAICVSSNSNQILLSVTGSQPVVRLWDLDTRHVVQSYRGHQENRYVVRAVLGGPNENFVISGSEDCRIYIWSRIFGTLLKSLELHSATVNSVSWLSKTNVPYLISASDDNTIGIWAADVN